MIALDSFVGYKPELYLRQDNLTSRMPTKLAIANTKEDKFWQFT
ncbi:hypothetical protein [Nostoc sp. ChiQUE01b]|nr:hypothetical protein [Nostoc sp. ChiQUE01b]MDZ8260687.1 hypothetical protein [Nostoc sp. ChiQUE01b]